MHKSSDNDIRKKKCGATICKNHVLMQLSPERWSGTQFRKNDLLQ